MTVDPHRESAAEQALSSYRDRAAAAFRPVPTEVIVNRARHRARVRVALAAATVVAAITGGTAAVAVGFLGSGRSEPLDTPPPGPVSSPASAAPAPSSGPSGPPSAATTGSPSKAPSTSPPTGDGVFSGRRVVTIGMESGPPAILILDGSGKLVGGQDVNDRSRFVLIPAGDAVQIRTATADPVCLGVRDTGDGPRVWATTCRASATEQRFTFTRTGGTDSRGRPTYTIGTTAGWLTFSSIGGLHIAAGDAVGFSLEDRGPAS